MEERIDLSKEALADLASQAAQEVSGVTGCLQNSVDALASRIKREFLRHGVKVEEEGGAYRFKIHIAVCFGEHPRIAAEMEARVKEYVEATAGVSVAGVEVIVEDIDLLFNRTNKMSQRLAWDASEANAPEARPGTSPHQHFMLFALREIQPQCFHHGLGESVRIRAFVGQLQHYAGHARLSQQGKAPAPGGGVRKTEGG